MKIKQSDLRKIFDMLMDYIPKSMGDEIEFHYDYYWDVSVAERQDVDNEPVITMGSIDHDLERLFQCLQDNDPINSHFRWLGNVLIAMEESLAPSRIYGNLT